MVNTWNDDEPQIGAEQIRSVERTILDQAYRNYALLHRDVSVALLSICQAWAAGYDYLQNEQHSRNDGGSWRTRLDMSIRGVGHCLRWILNHNGRRLQLTAPTPAEIQEEANEFLTWGVQYEMLSIDHTAWSRGALRATLNADEQTIAFSYPDGFDNFYVTTQVASLSSVISDIRASYPRADVDRGYRAWLKQGGTRLDAAGGLYRSPAYQRAYESVVSWLASTVLAEIPHSTALSGFSVGEFRQIWAELHLHSEYSVRAADQGVLEPRTEDEIQGWLFIVPVREFTAGLARSCDVPLSAAREILSDLTFDPRRARGTLVEQPLIPLGKEEWIVIPPLIATANPWDVLTRSLTKGRRAKAFSRISPQLERSAVSTIAGALRAHGFQVYEHPELRGEGGSLLTPDLVLVDNREHAVVVEYKHAFAPFGASEALSKLSEVRQWLQQLARYRRAVHGVSGEFFPRVADVSALLLLRWPMGVPVARADEFTMVDWPSLARWLSGRTQVYSSELVEWTRERLDVGIEASDFTAVAHEISVGGWIYKRTIFSAPAGELNSDPS